MEVQASDGTFIQESVGCNGYSAQVLADRKCYVPVETLKAAPWNLAYGSFIYARVKATNIVGDSDYSNVGNGA